MMSTPVAPGKSLKLLVKAKTKNIQYEPSHIGIDGWNGSVWRRLASPPVAPLGSMDWKEISYSTIIPADIGDIRIYLYGSVGQSWFDDLKIFQDDALIYMNKFTNWLPYQIAGAAITAVPVALYATKRMPKVTIPQEWWK